MNAMKKTLAVSLCAALAATAAPSAGAKVTLGTTHPDATVTHSSATEPFINGFITPRGVGRFDYSHPASQADNHQFDTSMEVRANGALVDPGLNAKPKVTTDGPADVLTYTQQHNDFLITRTYRIDGGRVDATVTVKNTGQAGGKVNIDLANALPAAAGATAKRDGNNVVVQPKTGGYVTDVSFTAPNSVATGATKAAALAGANNGAQHQAARWERTVAPGASISAGMSVTITPQDSVLDSDGDGLRDSWEAEGLRLADGTYLPIQRWGADPDRKDLFLQVNWMKSEWETIGCDRTERFAATLEDFAEFAACATANTKSYAPNPSLLKELEDLFDDHGINLHIDAGKSYVSESMASMTADERKGGETEPYTAEYFGGLDDDGRTVKLEEQANTLLGARRSVFRSALIGTRFDEKDKKNVTGLGQVNGSTFFISGDVTNSDELLRNTILHEFGHTLGLQHWGRETQGNTAKRPVRFVDTEDPSMEFDRPGYDWLETYKSTMSYAHQFSTFGFSDQEVRTTETIPNLADNSRYKPKDDEFDYAIPSDWDNLLFKTEYIGKGVRDHDGTADAPEVVADEERAVVDELISAATGSNNGKVGFSLARNLNNDNGIVAHADTNIIKGELRNLGSTDDTFTVVADYGVGEFTGSYFAKGDSNYITPVDIEVSPAAFVDEPVVPLHITVSNSEGARVFDDTFNVSALEYTPAEMDKVLKEVLASDADENLKAYARRRLKAAASETPTATAKPVQVPGKAEPSPSEKPSGSSDSPLGIIIGVLLGLIGLGAAGFGWAHSQGLLP